MLCSKCGSSVTDGIKRCPICDNVLVEIDLDATVLAGESGETTRSDETIVPPKHYKANGKKSHSAPKPQSSLKNRSNLKIGIAAASVIVVITVVFSVLVGTGKITINKNKDHKPFVIHTDEQETKEMERASISDLPVVTKDNETPVNEDDKPTVKGHEDGDATDIYVTVVEDNSFANKKEPTIKEPEFGSISDLPVVTGDISVKKVMLKMKTFAVGDNSSTYLAADYTNASEPKFYFSSNVKLSFGRTALAEYVLVGDMLYVVCDDPLMRGTRKTPSGNSADEANSAFGVFFGRYDKNAPIDYGSKFKYLGKESLDSVGIAYIYEYTTNESDTIKKVWIDADTGYWVKIETDGTITMEVSEIITGDDVDFPEFDFENAVEA